MSLESAEQLREVRDLIARVFSPADLEMLVHERFGVSLANLVGPGPHLQRVFELLQACDARGWLDTLLDGVAAERQQNPDVALLMRRMGRASAVAPAAGTRTGSAVGTGPPTVAPNALFMPRHLAEHEVHTGQPTLAPTAALSERALPLRTDARFEHAARYFANADEIFISAISHGFLLSSGMHAVEEHLKKAGRFKLILVDEHLSESAFRLIAEHDERNDAPYLRNEIVRAREQFARLEHLRARTGHLELRSARGIPDCTVTMLDPNANEGRIRVELRPYKRNDGPRPWFELFKSNEDQRPWYQIYYDCYYDKLWNDSIPILSF